MTLRPLFRLERPPLAFGSVESINWSVESGSIDPCSSPTSPINDGRESSGEVDADRFLFALALV